MATSVPTVMPEQFIVESIVRTLRRGMEEYQASEDITALEDGLKAAIKFYEERLKPAANMGRKSWEVVNAVGSAIEGYAATIEDLKAGRL